MNADKRYSGKTGERRGAPQSSRLKLPTRSAINRLGALPMLPMVGASSATAVSLGIATYAGWLRGGLPVERTMNIALGIVAVLYVHLLPMGWRTLRISTRVCAFVLWGVSLVVVLYAQLTFFMVSQQHAGEKRAASASANVTPASPKLPPARALTEVTREAARVSADMARTEARRCVGDCPALKTRETILAAQLAALKTEADEAKRHEIEEDRLNDQADRNEALRADPVASVVALWLGTTEALLELLAAFSYAIVLEGAAIIGWLMVSVAPGRAVGRATIVSDRGSMALDDEALALGYDIAARSRATPADNDAAGASGGDVPASEGAGSPATFEYDVLLQEIHKAVAAGRLKPTQAAIRGFLKCGQSKAGKLKRDYVLRFGGADIHGEWRNAP
ncbi:hypothetical protein [Burkholderia pseudomallei]|uniref:hypothetical protein n=1 Tax=Burkholderia pseudomallei TaxID=28450 RepID=UPI0021F789B0|nr:hypothetical protein [Burkholderia pseudomallei]MCW0022744.1 hypothetical protein [Burkholderia pseudomallei]MCW0168368.1 hypothetical protein [Burkholderia pseudomallei]